MDSFEKIDDRTVKITSTEVTENIVSLDLLKHKKDLLTKQLISIQTQLDIITNQISETERLGIQ